MTDQIITKDGDWAYACAPTERVEILTTTRPGIIRYPVLSMDAKGIVRGHTAYGIREISDDELYALVPLVRKPREWWLVLWPDREPSAHTTQIDAEQVAMCRARPIVHVIEAGGVK